MKCSICNGTGDTGTMIPVHYGNEQKLKVDYCSMEDWKRVAGDGNEASALCFEEGRAFAKILSNTAHGRFYDGMFAEMRGK